MVTVTVQEGVVVTVTLQKGVWSLCAVGGHVHSD